MLRNGNKALENVTLGKVEFMVAYQGRFNMYDVLIRSDSTSFLESVSSALVPLGKCIVDHTFPSFPLHPLSFPPTPFLIPFLFGQRPR